MLIDEEALRARIAELGEEISTDYAGRDLLLVGVLKGAVFFMADLMRHLTVPCEIDFMAISSYGDATDSSGVVRILKDLDINIEGPPRAHRRGHHRLRPDALVPDAKPRVARARLARGLRAADEARPPRDRRAGRYVGFEIPNRFVIGYGLDFAERYRNLPYVAVLATQNRRKKQGKGTPTR